MSSPFEGLREKLAADKDWPKIYMFKFIVPNDHQKLARAEAIFGSEAQISLRQSRTGKFVSLSAKELMISADEVVGRYEEANKIEGLISL